MLLILDLEIYKVLFVFVFLLNIISLHIKKYNIYSDNIIYMSQLIQIQANQFFIDGLTPLEIYNKGYIINIEILINAGYKLIQLNNIGLKKSNFTSAGYSIIDLKKAGYTIVDLYEAEYTKTDLKAAGYIIVEEENIHEPNDKLKDKQFLQKLCSNIGKTTSSSSSSYYCAPVINTIKAKDSTNTQSSKFSSYVQRGKYMTIYEGKVKELTFISATPTNVTIGFIPVGYVKSITFIAINQQNKLEQHSFTIVNSPYTITGLTPNSVYDITAISTYSSGNSYTEIFTNAIRTLNEGPPTNIRISKITNKTAFITFNKPIGIPSIVNITITNQNNVYDTQYIENITSDNYLITGLQIYNTYKFLITSIYNLSKNKYSVTFTFNTLYEDFPTNIIFNNINNDSATISYQYTGLPSYNSIIVVNNSNSLETYEQKTLENTVIFSNLTNNATYNVIINSVYTSENTYPIEIKDAFYILNEGPPTNVIIQYIKGTSILFSFNNAIGNPFEYELILINTNDSTETPITKTISKNNTENILIGGGGTENLNLTSNSVYILQLVSKYLQTRNTYVYQTNFQTLNEGIISNFVFTKIGNSFITFNYTNPPGEKYIINLIVNNPLDYKTINIDTNNYTLNGLLIDASYQLIINSIYVESNTTYTYTYPNIIRTINEGPSIISNINNITDQTYYINFSNPYKTPNKFIFTNTNLNIPTNIIDIEYYLSGNAFIYGLYPNSTYIITLNTIYNNDDNNNNTYTTNPSIEINTKGGPTDIRVDEYITDKNVLITFVAPIVLPTIYILTLNSDEIIFIPTNLIEVIQNLYYFGIIGLIPNTYYDMVLGAYYEDIDILYNQSFNVTTKGPVQNIQLLIVTDTSATILFDPPLLFYNWVYNIYLNNVLYYYNNNNTVFEFNELTNNTSYTVLIESVYNKENETQKFDNTFTFNTNSVPYNITVSNILDTTLRINWDKLLNQPTYYIVKYSNYSTTSNSFKEYEIIFYNVYNIDNNKNSFILSGLTPDISYSINELSSYYSNINTFYRNRDIGLLPIIMNSAPTNIGGITLSNKSVKILFTTPLNTNPTSYFISAKHKNNNNNVINFYINTIVNPTTGTSYDFTLTDLSDNIEYDIFVNSSYSNPSTNIIGKAFNISTYGTPNILSFSNIYTDSFTINIQPLLIPCNNYIFSFFNIRTKQTNTINGLFDNNGKYVTPSIFYVNDTYDVTIQSVYNTNSEIYTSITKSVSTSSPPNIINYISTDISAIIYFIPPTNPPSSYNYIISNSPNSVTTNVYTDINNKYYFIVYGLQATTIYSIILNSYYSDINKNYSSDSILIYSSGPPTNLNIDAKDILNTYVNLSFINPYQCSTYNIKAIQTNNPTEITSKIIQPLQPSLINQNTINYTLNDLLEDTSYNISITSIYSNYSGISNTVQIHTFKAIQIEKIINITDVSAMVFVTTHPTILPNDIDVYFTYTIGNNDTTNTLDITSTYISDSATNYIFIIDNLSPNVKYDPFIIKSYYIQADKTFNSINKPFSTKGITDIQLYVTDISTTIFFTIPYILPTKYYYALNNYEPVLFTPVVNNQLQYKYTISDLLENTNYTDLIIQTQYSDISGTYFSQDVSFCTKIIPKPTYIVSDVQLDVSFVASIVPYDISYSYLLDKYTYNYPNISFTPDIDINGIVSLSIPALIPNTFYDIFKINIYYSDTKEIYSSKNYSFNTMGSPSGASISSVDSSILFFYPPLYIPDYYIITISTSSKNILYDSDSIIINNDENDVNTEYFPDNNELSQITEKLVTINTNTFNVYVSDMSYVNNVYSYRYPLTFSDISNIYISSYYSLLNKTIPVNIWTKTNVSYIITNNISEIQTNFSGEYVKIKQNPSITYYYSSDYGKTWSITPFSNTIDITLKNKNKSDDNNIEINWINTTGLYINGNYLLSSYVTDINNAIISGNGMYIYAYDNTNIYSYAIPIEKSSAYGLTIPTTTNTIAYLSFYQPTFIPDLSYEIIITNHYISSEIYKYYTLQNQNIPLSGLNQNALYDISLNTNYSNILQTFTTGLLSAFYTKSAPIQLKLFGNPTDSSANIEFIEPIIKPQYYILRMNDINSNIQSFSFTKKSAKGIDYNYNIQPNDISINSFIINDLSQNTYYYLTLSSFYNENNIYISNDVSFYTRGYPYNLTVNRIYDTSVNVSFTSPSNITDILRYTITCISGSNYINTNTTTNQNNIVTGLLPNSIYDIQLSTQYLNPIQTLTSTLYQKYLYTKGGPIIDISFASITDISANIQIKQFPTSIINNPSLFSKYQLYVQNTTTIFTDITRIYSTDISYIIVPSKNLSQNTIYNISIKTFYTDTSSTFFSNNIIVPTQGYPANITSNFNYITDTSANIIFSPAVNSPEQYKVYVYTVNSYKPPYEDIGGFTGITTIPSIYVTTSLKPDTRYYIFVSSLYTDTNIKTNPNSFPFTTAGPPKTVSINTNSITDTSANITFSTTSLNPSKYMISIKRYDNNLITNTYDISFTQQPSSYTYTITDLPKNTNLYVVVQSIYPNITLSTVTDPSFTTIGPPRNIDISRNSINNTSIIIRFNSPLSTQSNILYNIILKNTTINSINQINNISSPYIFNNLSSNSSYELILQAQYSNGLISNSNIIGFNTEGSVTNILPKNITDTQTDILFQLCPNTPNSYNLNISGGLMINKTFENIVNPYTVTDLPSNSIYNIQITSNYNSNWNVLF
jgi:hypothetical protein